MSRSSIMRLLVLVAACVACAAQDARASRTVRTAQGPVRGYKADGDDVYRFYGVPYATAPTGTRRFTAPLPGPVWMQPVDAVKDNIICPQPNSPLIDMSKYEMREDCLVANVFVPDTEETNLPVVVYVHGGGYHMGFGNLASPTRLVRSKKVVAVTFNYRLGAHGFLCLGTELAPGNAGMKDAVALLRWVQKNIANFGGNPDDVTIAGYSAGSSVVDLLMLSKITKGLYNKVIPESGSHLASWSVQLDPVQFAKDFAKTQNFTNIDNIDALETFYTTEPFEALTTEQFLARTDSLIYFTPCIERNIGVEVFLDDAPVNILKQGNYRKVPILYGFANMEGLLRAQYFEKWKDGMNERFSDFLPGDLQFENDEEKQKVAEAVKEFYFGDKRVAEETILGFIDYFTDITFAYSHLKSIKLQVEAGSDSLYLYEYTFVNPGPKDAKLPEYLKNIDGANHCAQTMAVLQCDLMSMNETEELNRNREVMVELWLNFITTGKPVPEGSSLPSWPPVGADWSPHMELGSELKLKGPLLEQRARFWDSIYEKHYKAPVAPQTRSSKVRIEL